MHCLRDQATLLSALTEELSIIDKIAVFSSPCQVSLIHTHDITLCHVDCSPFLNKIILEDSLDSSPLPDLLQLDIQLIHLFNLFLLESLFNLALDLIIVICRRHYSLACSALTRRLQLVVRGCVSVSGSTLASP